VRQIVILVSLLAILAASARLGARMEAGTAFDATTLTTTGFILLAAYSLGEVFRRLRLPALLGYLAAGMLFGPSLAEIAFGSASVAPIDEGALHQLGLVNMLAVGVIGTLGGGEIRIEDLRESFR
jgi:Kef-type K+ transport system membrane component KefB